MNDSTLEARYSGAPTSAGKIFAAMAAVAKAINAMGVAKTGHNKKQGYFFRGIDATLDAFAGPLSTNQIMVLPDYHVEREWTIETGSGAKMQAYLVRGMFTLLSTEDGSSYRIGPFYGEASDSLDKAMTKAQSVCLRTALLQSFAAPLGPDADPEHEEEPEKKGKGKAKGGKKGEPKEDGKQAEGTPLDESQKKLLTAKLESKGLAPADLARGFGKVFKENFSGAIHWINEGEGVE